MHEGIENHRFSLVVAHRRFGKTVAAVNALIKSAVQCERIEPRYGYVAPFRTQAEQIAWSYLTRFTRPIPGTKENLSQLSVTLPNTAQIRLFGADNPHTLRGLYFDGLVLDEPAQMRDNLWDEVLLPTLADRKGWALFIGTPMGVNKFYEIAAHAQKDRSWFYAEFPAFDSHGELVTDALDVEDIEIQRSMMPKTKFRQEYLCDFTASGENTLITIDLVNQAMAREYPLSAYYSAPIAIGVDPARFGDDRFVILVRQGLALRWYGAYHEIDTMTGAGIVSEHIKKWEPAAVFVDSIGVGAGVADRLRQLGHTIIEVQSGERAVDDERYMNKRAEMWDKMRLWLEEGGGLPEDPELRNDLVAPLYSYDAKNRMVLEKKESMKERGLPSPDIADALALTFALPVHPRKTPQEMERAKKSVTRNDPYRALYA
jgi:hypothetical protein